MRWRQMKKFGCQRTKLQIDEGAGGCEQKGDDATPHQSPAAELFGLNLPRAQSE
jgi:hypothetical protein